MTLNIAVLKETAPGERRVAATPETVRKLIGMGCAVKVQAGAGDGAALYDQAFAEAGATVVGSAEDAVRTAQAVGAVWAFTTIPRVELEQLAVHVPELAVVLGNPRLAAAPDVYPANIALVELSKRELLVLARLADGSTVQSIATALFVSPNTVKTQLRSVYQKLNVDSRHGAIARAREWGLLLG